MAYLELCSNGHGEICHCEKHCPACEALEDLRDKMQEEIDTLREDL